MSTTQPPPPPPPSGTAAPAPAGPPPPDPATLPHNSLKPNLYAAAVICWVIGAIFVALRFYTRGVIIRVLGWSDWSSLAALIFSAGTSVAIIDQTYHGSGAHIWDLDPADTADAVLWTKATWYGIIMYLLSLWFSKMAILFLYIHIFAFKWARLAGQILFGIVAVSTLFMVIATFTACIPLHAYWDFYIPRDQVYCHPQSVWWANTGMHMITDFLIFLLPMPVVWSIMLPRRQKMMLFGVFGFGFVVCFISIIRLLKLYQNDKYPDPDFTYGAAGLSYLTVVEVNAAIVCACVMTLKPFISKFFPGLLGSRGSGSGGEGQNQSDLGGRGPPTIGSRPSKQPLSPADSELMGKIGGSNGSSRRYADIDEEWGIDVELADGDGGKRDAAKSEGIQESTTSKSDEDVVTRIDEKAAIKQD